MGTNKALLPIDGKPMIQWVADSLKSVFEHVVISADQEEDLRFLGLRVIPDVVKHCGPLGGIHTALLHAAPRPIFVLPCDMPYFSADAIRSILAFPSDASARIVSGAGRIFPLCGYYDQRAFRPISVSIASGTFKMTELTQSLKADLLEFPRNSREIVNINTPADLAIP